MSRSLRAAMAAAVVCACFAAIPGNLAAQVAVRIERLPERLVLPLPPGRNQVLTATVTGDARAVWLAVDRAATAKVALRPAGDRQYQVNLASEEVTAILVHVRPKAKRPSFAIFAEAADGVVAESVPVRYEVVGRDAAASVHLVYGAGRSERVTKGLSHRWFTAEDIAELRVYPGNLSLAEPPRACIDGASWVFARDGAEFHLALGGEFLETWLEHGAMEVELQPGERLPLPIVLRARPIALALEGGASQFTVKQRQSAYLPGSRSYFRLRIDDITGNQVLVKMHNAEGKVVIQQRPMREGDHLEFAVGTDRYFLVLDKLVNFLIGDDHAEFTVARDLAAAVRIVDLLLWIEESELTFVRNGEDVDGERAARHLRGKYAFTGQDLRTTDQFIERMATSSSQTGEPYLVRLADGTEMPLPDWLRAEIQRRSKQRDK